MAKQKFYVVWRGRTVGVFDNWATCRNQIDGFGGAVYKSFPTRAEAEAAYRNDARQYVGNKSKAPKPAAAPDVETDSEYEPSVGWPIIPSLAVDAACSRNVGPLEYQGVMTDTGELAFHQGPFDDGTNNVGEFLALVHGLAYLKQLNSPLPLYSDSRVAIGWVWAKKANTTLARTGRNDKLFELLKRAHRWLRDNTYETKILKWETAEWGEIPADFGRK